MATRPEIPERQLLESARCLLRAPGRIPYLPPMDELVAETALTNTLRASFDDELQGGVLPVEDIRALYEKAFRAVSKKVGYLAKSQEPPARDVIATSKTFRNFLAEYRVWQPVTPYWVNLGRASIRGDYAIVQKRGNPEAPLSALRYWPKDTKQRGMDVITYARYLHLRHAETDEECQILHWDNSGIPRAEIPPEAGLRPRLTFLLNTILDWEKGELAKSGKDVFPSPGEHCDSCQTHACEQTRRGDASDILTRIQTTKGKQHGPRN